MNPVKRARRFFFLWMTAFISLYQIFVRAERQERTWPYVTLTIAAAIVTGWIAGCIFGAIVNRQTARHRRLQPDLKEGETILASCVAGHRLYGGKLVLTDKRLRYLTVSHGTPKPIVERGIESIREIRLGKTNRLHVTTTDGTTLTFKPADSPLPFAQAAAGLFPSAPENP